MLTRRWFIGGLASWGAFAGSRGFFASAGGLSGRTPKLRFGVVSDIHLSAYPGASWAEKDAATFVHAMEWFRAQGVDAVMIAGDMADNGMTDQLESVAKAWFRVFPADRRPDGRTVARIFTLGNHDWAGHAYGNHARTRFPDPGERAGHILANDIGAHWERIFHEPFSPVYRREVNGYAFIGAHWTNGDARARNETGVAGVEEFFAAHGKELDPKLPFFYAQHPHPRMTCYGKDGWGQDDGRAARALSAFPNAVAFSGHSHAPLTNERSIWQGAFTSLGTSSLRYTGGPGLNPPGAKRGWENRRAGRDSSIVKLMKNYNGDDGRQGMLVSVYDDCIVFARRDFVYDLPLGDDWILPLPAAEAKPFDFAARARKSVAPEFAVDAKIAFAQTAAAATESKQAAKERRRTGVRQPREKHAGVRLTFPAALAQAKARPFAYEVTAVPADGETGSLRTFHVLAQGYNQGREHPKARGDSFAVIPVAELPAGPEIRFEVRPVDSFGNKGRAIAATMRFSEHHRNI